MIFPEISTESSGTFKSTKTLPAKTSCPEFQIIGFTTFQTINIEASIIKIIKTIEIICDCPLFILKLRKCSLNI